MKRTNLTIVGAGPVGLAAALAAARHGLTVQVLEAQAAIEPIGYATLLHSATLDLLAEIGLADAVERAGQRVECLSVHVDRDRVAAVDLTRTKCPRPYCVALSQLALQRMLLDAVAQEAEVSWNQEVTGLDDHGDHVLIATRTQTKVSDFVIGADGYTSFVRRAVGIDVVDLESTESWAMFEVLLDRDLGHEAHLALHDQLVSAAWPLPGGKARFSFQLFRGLDVAPDSTLLESLISERMPWLRSGTASIEWSSVTDFEHLLATRFGEGNVWLAGDAAHVTSPAGAHSLNIGLREGCDIARYLSDRIGGIVTQDVFSLYERERQQEWRRLLGIDLDARLGPRAPSELGPYLGRLIPCLPASGPQLDAMLARLGIVVLAPEAPPARAVAPPA